MSTDKNVLITAAGVLAAGIAGYFLYTHYSCNSCCGGAKKGCGRSGCTCTDCKCGASCSCGNASSSATKPCTNPTCTCGDSCKCGDACKCGK